MLYRQLHAARTRTYSEVSVQAELVDGRLRTRGAAIHFVWEFVLCSSS